MSGELRLRTAEPSDAEALSSIAFAAKAHWGYPAEWLEAWREALTVRPEWVSEHVAIVAERGGASVGFVGLVRRDPRVWILEHLWVLPTSMGQGVGRLLFRRAELLARVAGAGILEFESDPFAEAFYLRMGARRVGEVRAPVLGVERSLPLMALDLR